MALPRREVAPTSTSIYVSIRFRSRSLSHDRSLLLAVNFGSDTITIFNVHKSAALTFLSESPSEGAQPSAISNSMASSTFSTVAAPAASSAFASTTVADSTRSKTPPPS